MALVTLEEAKRQLDITGTSEDVELQTYIDALPAVIEGIVGVVEQREVTDIVTGGGTTLAVLHPPLVSVSSLAGRDVSYPTDGLTVNGPAGIIGRLGGGTFPVGDYTVTYTAGRPEVPPTIKLAALILLQHLWRTQRATRGGLAGGGDDYSVTEPIPGFGYAVPHRVMQLLDSFRLPPGVA
ncbi:head-tail connector protein [Streptomyces sp. AVP053U2]|uniref:head-tail connector protein n=1 Tax=Streptomyces sp. AVP053U2 TaxID=1737066 RepID=UPI00073B7FCF|nr:head-tail connector protein [Streptomyces sp. AVP053U2]ODA69516.1 hypothetical protein APS67_006320 [Streptomyces sp. AVP053U2]